jgi:hypothetical protein
MNVYLHNSRNVRNRLAVADIYRLAVRDNIKQLASIWLNPVLTRSLLRRAVSAGGRE